MWVVWSCQVIKYNVKKEKDLHANIHVGQSEYFPGFFLEPHHVSRYQMKSQVENKHTAILLTDLWGCQSLQFFDEMGKTWRRTV